MVNILVGLSHAFTTFTFMVTLKIQCKVDNTAVDFATHNQLCSFPSQEEGTEGTRVLQVAPLLSNQTCHPL
jgi:hypothetical protein